MTDPDALQRHLQSLWEFEAQKYYLPPRELIAVIGGLRAKGYDRYLWPRTQISPGPIGKPSFRFGLSPIPWKNHQHSSDPRVTFKWVDDSGLGVMYEQSEDYLWFTSFSVVISPEIETLLTRLMTYSSD